MPFFEITKQATFDAAHHLPNEPEGSIYRRVHGHSFTVEATVRSEVLDVEHGWVADLGALDRALDRLIAGFDHPLVTPLVELEPDDVGNLVMLANVYAAARRWSPPPDPPAPPGRAGPSSLLSCGSRSPRPEPPGRGERVVRGRWAADLAGQAQEASGVDGLAGVLGGVVND